MHKCIYCEASEILSGTDCQTVDDLKSLIRMDALKSSEIAIAKMFDDEVILFKLDRHYFLRGELIHVEWTFAFNNLDISIQMARVLKPIQKLNVNETIKLLDPLRDFKKPTIAEFDEMIKREAFENIKKLGFNLSDFNCYAGKVDSEWLFKDEIAEGVDDEFELIKIWEIANLRSADNNLLSIFRVLKALYEIYDPSVEKDISERAKRNLALFVDRMRRANDVTLFSKKTRNQLEEKIIISEIRNRKRSQKGADKQIEKSLPTKNAIIECAKEIIRLRQNEKWNLNNLAESVYSRLGNSGKHGFSFKNCHKHIKKALDEGDEDFQFLHKLKGVVTK